METGQYRILDFLAYADVGTVLHPRALGGQILGRSILGIGHAHRPEVGLRPAVRPGPVASAFITPSRRRFWTFRQRWSGLRWKFPDPETPIGARGIGEPPVGGGCAAILNALVRRARRRNFPARASHFGRDPDFARSGQAHARSAESQYLIGRGKSFVLSLIFYFVILSEARNLSSVLDLETKRDSSLRSE